METNSNLPILSIIISIIGMVTGITGAIFSGLQYNENRKSINTNIELKKSEHFAFFEKKWKEINQFIRFIPNYKAEIIAKNGNKDEIINTLNKILEELEIENLKTACLFDVNITEKQDLFLTNFKNLIPQVPSDWTIYNILDEYTNLLSIYNELKKLYQNENL